MTRQEIQDAVLTIAQEYHAQSLTLTVRQAYYQLVSRGMGESSQKYYKRVVAALADARCAGEFPMHLIVDRGRTVHEGDFTDCRLDVDDGEAQAQAYVENLPFDCLDVDRWHNQPIHTSVWVEKEALSGVFEKPCKDLGVSWFACKGYPSLSALWEWMKNIEGSEHQQAKVLYFGDHDPDGWEIPRAAERRLNELAEVWGLDIPLISFERIALNMQQIQLYDPPPFWAKPSSSRYKGYIEEHDTDQAWELDALDPATLRALITTEVDKHFDETVHQTNMAMLHDSRVELVQRLKEPGWMESVWG